MAWNVQYDQSSGIIEVTYTGIVTGLELREAASKRISLQEKTGTALILVDSTQVDSGPSTSDMFNLPDKLYADLKPSLLTRMALVLSKSEEPRNLGDFFETVAQNRGWRVKVFEDRHRAVTWLRKDAASDKTSTTTD